MDGGERLLGWQRQEQRWEVDAESLSKVVDRDRWVTISQIAGPLKVGTAMAK